MKIEKLIENNHNSQGGDNTDWNQVIGTENGAYRETHGGESTDKL